MKFILTILYLTQYFQMLLQHEINIKKFNKVFYILFLILILLNWVYISVLGHINTL